MLYICDVTRDKSLSLSVSQARQRLDTHVLHHVPQRHSFE